MSAEFATIVGGYSTAAAALFAVVGIPLALLQQRAANFQHIESVFSSQIVSYLDSRSHLPNLPEHLGDKVDWEAVAHYTERLSLLVALAMRLGKSGLRRHADSIRFISVDLRKLFRICAGSFLGSQTQVKILTIHAGELMAAFGPAHDPLAVRQVRGPTTSIMDGKFDSKKLVGATDLQRDYEVAREASRTRAEIIRSSLISSNILGIFRRLPDLGSRPSMPNGMLNWVEFDYADTWLVVEGLREPTK